MLSFSPRVILVRGRSMKALVILDKIQHNISTLFRSHATSVGTLHNIKKANKNLSAM